MCIRDRDINVSSGDSVILNTGENGGVINIFQLTEKLNQTIQELEQLRGMFNSHVHSGVTTGPGSSGPTLTQVIKPFSQFVVDDYEDKTCIQMCIRDRIVIDAASKSVSVVETSNNL